MKFKPKNLIVITGCSGAGKTAAALELLKKHKDVSRLVTYTTRKKRKGEKNGRDYNFITEKEFKKMRDAGEFFEWANVYGKYYGNGLCALKECCENSKFCLMVIDVQGAVTAKRRLPGIKVFFISAKPEELLFRLVSRGYTTAKEIKIRQGQIEKEFKASKKFDYIVENKTGKLDKTVEKIEKILKLK